MRKICIISTLYLISGSLFGQSNPGYLGHTSAVEISNEISFPIFSGHGPLVATQISLAYEKSMAKDFGLKGGVRLGSTEMDAVKHELDIFSVEDLTNQSTSPSGGTLKYTTTEFFIQPRYYFTESGAISPFGRFIGMELALTNIGIEDNLKWNSRAFVPPAVTEGLTAISISVQWGQRRVIFDNICYNYHFGIGANVYNTGNANISVWSDEITNSQDGKAVVHEMVLAPVQWGRLFHMGLGLSYLF